ncbi:MAG: hypothetical protein M3Y87_16130 [Myxococcota bacterium]|nr:hypothetical protein [Myxococcota bacterium]
MSRLARSLLCVFALAVPAAVAGCAASHSTVALEVEASIASVTLAEDCAGDAERRDPGLIAGDCAEGFADCGWCTQTGVQLSIDAADGDTSVPFEVLAVRVRSMDGALLDELDPRGAQLFQDDGYVSWDERIAPGQTLRVRYDTGAPDWTAIGGGNSWETYGMEFQIEMVVRIDGVERTLTFAPASREAEIVT